MTMNPETQKLIEDLVLSQIDGFYDDPTCADKSVADDIAVYVQACQDLGISKARYMKAAKGGGRPVELHRNENVDFNALWDIPQIACPECGAVNDFAVLRPFEEIIGIFCNACERELTTEENDLGTISPIDWDNIIFKLP